MSPDDFEKLLNWFDPDREKAAEKYEAIRKRLIGIMIRKGCWEAEDVVDEAFERAAEKVDEVRPTYVGDPAHYIGGIARHVFHEWVRRITPPPIPETFPPDDLEPELDCLDECLKKLRPKDRDFVLEYYEGEGQERIVRRKAMAEREGLEMEALRLRAFRLRKVLRDCVAECLKRQGVGPESSGSRGDSS
ncbi:MAG: RNA polymerase sigma factor [Blastocatellia bacterium]